MKTLNKKALLSIVLIATSGQLYAEESTNLCQSGYLIGFFNGVSNTKVQALIGIAKLRSIHGQTYKNEPLRYEVFYNTTGIDRSRLGILEDMAETFIQRDEVIGDGSLKNMQIFWEILASNPSSKFKTYNEQLANESAPYKSYYEALSESIYSIIRTSISAPTTEMDSVKQQLRVKAHLTEGKKIVMVAHSQGNLFMTEAYKVGLTIASPESIKAVHIAPPLPLEKLKGDYTLADIDFIINPLRLQGLSTVAESNVKVPFSHLLTDKSGHKLIETYLNQSIPTYEKVRLDVEKALDQLVKPATQGNVGFFTVTMEWDGQGDVDLHTYEPDETHVYYQNPEGSAGILDVDNTIGKGPEHYYATCDSNKILYGSYRIGINNFSGATGRTATVQIASIENGELFTKSLSVGPERDESGDDNPIPVAEVIVSRDIFGNTVARMKN